MPNLSMGPPVVRSIRRVATVPLDVHLMLDNPDQHRSVRRGRRADTGCRACGGAAASPSNAPFIRSCGAKAGVALNPSTPVFALEEIAGDVDQVLVMSVNLGVWRPDFHPPHESLRSARSARCSIAQAIRLPSRSTAVMPRTPPGSWLRAPRSSSPEFDLAGGRAELATRELRAAALQQPTRTQ